MELEINLANGSDYTHEIEVSLLKLKRRNSLLGHYMWHPTKYYTWFPTVLFIH